jgi:hypothetical protein
MSKLIEQIPKTLVSTYSPVVRFDVAVYVTQHTLITDDVITPLTTDAQPAHGAIYRLIGDGTHAPIFHPIFKKSITSKDYVMDVNTLNLIIFMYDGFDYWYTITQPVAPILT